MKNLNESIFRKLCYPFESVTYSLNYKNTFIIKTSPLIPAISGRL